MFIIIKIIFILTFLLTILLEYGNMFKLIEPSIVILHFQFTIIYIIKPEVVNHLQVINFNQ